MGDFDEYNPLDYDNLTENLVRELLTRGPFSLPPVDSFSGAGVYALFYSGDFAPYRQIRSQDASAPIYVGKAAPSGSRKGSGAGSSNELANRLKEHSRSITDAKNLSLDDFECRFLVVTPLWITMAERFLIERFRPIWNTCVDGFGIHDPGKGRHKGAASRWDTLHPGRSWVKNLASERSAADVVKELAAFLKAAQAG